MPAAPVADDALALQRLYHWARTTPDRIAFTQPLGSGRLREFTWAQVLDESRRIAAHLRRLGIGPGDKVALLSKNTAWWLMADYAIWMAGAVSVPLYPTLAAGTVRQILAHSEARLLFVGKLDGWAAMRTGVPDALPCIVMPLAPAGARGEAWEAIAAATAPRVRNCARVSCNSAASAVVFCPGTSASGKPLPSVPSTAQGRPVASSARAIQ